MCRNIKTLFNFEPPASAEEVRAAALQFVRKLSGFQSPSKANQPAFELAIEEIAAASGRLLAALTTTAGPRDRELEATKARARSAERFGPVR
ncbi:MAG: hypothetical protein QG573_1875 [Acidobacteriota bacterium]|nr:hypothetical protein [Acidobacteriota bacterium]